jgi:hypothetical protein
MLKRCGGKRVNCSREYRPFVSGNTDAKCERTRALKPVTIVFSDLSMFSDVFGEGVY